MFHFSLIDENKDFLVMKVRFLLFFLGFQFNLCCQFNKPLTCNWTPVLALPMSMSE